MTSEAPIIKQGHGDPRNWREGWRHLDMPRAGWHVDNVRRLACGGPSQESDSSLLQSAFGIFLPRKCVQRGWTSLKLSCAHYWMIFSRALADSGPSPPPHIRIWDPLPEPVVCTQIHAPFDSFSGLSRAPTRGRWIGATLFLAIGIAVVSPLILRGRESMYIKFIFNL